MDKLTSLRKITAIVADTIDANLINNFKPQDVTTNPSLIFQAAQNSEYQTIVNEAIIWALRQSNSYQQQIIDACDKLSVNIGLKLLQLINGRISTEVDARLSYNSNASIKKAHRIIELYNNSGIENDRVFIKIASTWQGIRAAEQLEKDGINCNLTLVFSLAQARACAEAGVHLISPFVGRILDWYKDTNAIKEYFPQEDPGVISVTKIYNYYKEHNYQTLVMGASFRNIDEILQLAGCDLLTISPVFLRELTKLPGEVIRKLEFNGKIKSQPKKMTESEFFSLHNLNLMASVKLAEGINKFSTDQNRLEKMIAYKLTII